MSDLFSQARDDGATRLPDRFRRGMIYAVLAVAAELRTANLLNWLDIDPNTASEAQKAKIRVAIAKRLNLSEGEDRQ